MLGVARDTIKDSGHICVMPKWQDSSNQGQYVITIQYVGMMQASCGINMVIKVVPPMIQAKQRMAQVGALMTISCTYGS